MTQKEARTANSTYKKLAVQWLNEALCFVSSFVLKIPAFGKPQNVMPHAMDDRANIKLTDK